MHSFSRRYCFLPVLGWLASACVMAVAAVTPVNIQDYPAIQLRGYGTLSGTSTQWQMPGGPASILQIHCDDVDKAKIVHAKYLSDLGLLPGVKEVDVDPVGLPHYQISGKNDVFAAARLGADVYIFQAGAASDLAPLMSAGFTGDRSGLVFKPESEVPMFLDRWDRYGFRFYYHPWERPRVAKGQPSPPYDYNQDIDFAVKSGHSGIIIWDGNLNIDSAATEMKGPLWNWEMKAAQANQLPAGINFLLGGPLWLANEYRNETMFKAHDFLGDWIGAARTYFSSGFLSYSSVKGRDAILEHVQQTVRQYQAYPNMISWEDPNGEMPFTPQSLMTDLGPTADAGYRRYLQDKYHDVATVSQRWYGDGRLQSWNDVHVPQLSHFRGDGPDAIDLEGDWRVGWELGPGGKSYTRDELKALRNKPVPTEPAPEAWFQPGFNDSAWPQLHAPGDDVAFFMPKRPAVFRRNFNVDSSILKKNDHWYLYVWDLNSARSDKLLVYLNGAKVGESAIFEAHWAAFDVTGNLQAGSNQISLRLPNGYIGYRIYLSPQPVTDYPNLGEKMNAEWVDFINWNYDARVDAMRRSVEMIRQIDPNRQIIFHHPDGYAEGVIPICEDFGCEFHCSGYMSAFFADPEPMLSRGSDLPCSLEPGGPAHDLDGFKNQMGLNLSEGAQGIDYFRDLHDALWIDSVRDHVISHANLLHMIGKYHVPKGQIAMLIDDREEALTGYPWGTNPNVVIRGGWWECNVTAGLVETFPVDGVTVTDFSRGNAAKYRVILDSNSTIMDEETVNQIENYVRNGGIFITALQTGRHSPTQMDSWPIERLTGYHVTHIDKADESTPPETQPIHPAPGQNIFSSDDWNEGVKPNGLSLTKAAGECQDLMLWQDGKTAIGIRPLGKGFIVEVGVRFGVHRPSDRWEGTPTPDDAMLAKLYTQLLDHFQIARIPATLSDPYSPVLWRHYLSNNGLYDVWSFFNRSKTSSETVSLQLAKGFDPASCLEIKNQPAPFQLAKTDAGTSLPNIALEPLETRMFITPRSQLEHAATDWFALQRAWWRGTAQVRKELPPFHDDYAQDLSVDWGFQPLENGADVKTMITPGFDDSKWERRPLGAWGIGDHSNVKHAVLRKTFTVPAAWNHGQVFFWLMNDNGPVFEDSGHVYIDGQEIAPSLNGSFAQLDLGGNLKAGSTHTIVLEVSGASSLVGIPASAWLSYWPNPEDSIDLSGAWLGADDYMTYDKKLTFPGAWQGVVARRSVRVDSKYSGKNIFIDFDGPFGTADSNSGVIINGVFLGHAPNVSQSRWQINITPWIKFGADNDIRVVSNAETGKEKQVVASVKLDIYDASISP